MSDSVSNLVGNADPRHHALPALQNANVPLTDLFSDVLNKTKFADQMLSPAEFGLARAAERDLEHHNDLRDSDQDDAVAEAADDASVDSASDGEQSQASDESGGESESEGQAESSPSRGAQAAAAEDALANLPAGADKEAKAGLDVQPNAASGVELQSKGDGPTPGQARAEHAGGGPRASAQTGANPLANDALNKEATAQANAVLNKLQAGASGQQIDASAGKAAQAGDAAAAEQTTVKAEQKSAHAPTAADGEGDAVADAVDSETLLRRAGSKLAAELHHMKVQLAAHRDALKKAFGQAQETNGAQVQIDSSGKGKPSVAVTAPATPPAPAAATAASARTATPFNAAAATGQPGNNNAAVTLTFGNGDAAAGTAEALAADRQNASAAASRAATQRPAFTPPAQQTVDQIKVHIQQLAKSGAEQIQIKLSPATLGRVEVALEMTPDKTVHAVVYADNPETLDMLERDARVLQRAFEDAGMKFDSDGLTFKHGQSAGPETQLANNSGRAAAGDAGEADESDGIDAGELPASEQPRRRQHDGMLDLEI